LRIRAYFRVDLGLSYDLLHNKTESKLGKKGWQQLDQALISLEIFNILGVNNVLSKQWIQDVQGKFYSVPNYLTQRLFNLKFSVGF
jgi:uncharacterized protein YtpQ (UPF0354 family)